MNNEELKKKIVDILNKIFTERDVIPVHTAPDGKKTALPDELCEIFNKIVVQAVIPYFADALIAAGIGDVKDLQAQVNVLEITNIALQAGYDDAEKDRLYWVNKYKEAEHRADVAERALNDCVEYYSWSGLCPVLDCNYNKACWQKKCTSDIAKCFKIQAEKELAEEKR